MKHCINILVLIVLIIMGVSYYFHDLYIYEYNKLSQARKSEMEISLSIILNSLLLSNKSQVNDYQGNALTVKNSNNSGDVNFISKKYSGDRRISEILGMQTGDFDSEDIIARPDNWVDVLPDCEYYLINLNTDEIFWFTLSGPKKNIFLSAIKADMNSVKDTFQTAEENKINSCTINRNDLALEIAGIKLNRNDNSYAVIGVRPDRNLLTILTSIRHKLLLIIIYVVIVISVVIVEAFFVYFDIKKLKNQVANLAIQLNYKARDSEVNEITDSQFFINLQDKINELRQDKP